MQEILGIAINQLFQNRKANARVDLHRVNLVQVTHTCLLSEAVQVKGLIVLFLQQLMK